MKKLLIVLFSVLGLSACKEPTAAKVAVTYGTMRYIDQAGPTGNIQRAARVAAVANQVLAILDNESVDLRELKARLIQELPADLSMADRTLAIALIASVDGELNTQIGGDVLTPETRIKAKKVLGWVIEATAYYEQQPER